MSVIAAQGWYIEIKTIHALGQNPGEDLRYDDTFSQLKNQNAAVSPDATWMIEKADLFVEKSADLRVCIYAMHAATILGEAQAFTQIMQLYAYLISEKFNESFPVGDKQKIATFEWCINSHLVDLIKGHAKHYQPHHIDQIKSAINKIHYAIEKRMGEALKWHNLLSWLENQTPESTKPQVVKEVAPDVDNSRDSKTFFDKFVRAVLKEEQYERAVGLARAHRWGGLSIPVHKNQKNRFC